jgi:hypothetical protein
LTDAEVALLLQVARAYGFKEEVALLGQDLLQRFRSTSASGERRFWAASLLNLSLDDNEVATDDGNALILSALESLARVGPRRSWEQVAGFLNLLAAYYWKGDFYTDGTVELVIDDAAPVSISLGPELPGSGFLKFPLSSDQLATGAVDLRLNTTSALSPVLIAGIGTSGQRPDVKPLRTVGIEWQREYFEETLMQGMRRRVAQLDSALSGIRAGDRLRVIIDVEIEEDQPFAAFRFPVPGGFSLDPSAIEHLWQPLEDAPVRDVQLWVDSGETAPALQSIVRMAPLPAGRHRFELSYDALWAGTYAWPEMRLYLPRTGTTYRLSDSTRVTIQPAGE